MSSRISIDPIPPHTEASAPSLVKLNEVVQQALQAIQSGTGNKGLIVRCEELPAVEGDPSQLVALFGRLLSTITLSATQTVKQFLYIDCEELASAEGIQLSHGYKRFQLQVHTNITTTEAWKTAHAETLQDCRESLGRLEAGFTVNEVHNTGCLFSISLFGKL